MSDSGFRQDIQGLRAVAVVMVFAYHMWPGGLTGGFVGVDVFFVISGYLITAHLIQHPPLRARDLLEFWGRRIRRLLPAAFVVLAAVAIASRVLAPETRWGANAGQIIASALYVENWVLAGSSVDYLAAAEAPTPVQHYWSLSVEEQFYLFWPILILAVYWLSFHARARPLIATRAAMLAVIAISLFISITATATEPASAYFITPTRVWELAAGGFIATVPPLSWLGLPQRLVSGVAWLGLALVLAAGFVITSDTPFPGSAAILPVAGTALVILAAAQARWSPTGVLRLRPIQHLGDTSYSIYLWHWPLIVFWPYVSGHIGRLDTVLIIATTIALATLTKVFVEDAFRFRPSFQPLVPTFRFAAVGMLVLSLVGGAQLVEAQLRFDAAVASENGDGGSPDVQPTDEPAIEPSDAPSAAVGATTAPGGTQPPGPTFVITSCTGAAAIVRGFAACPQDPASAMVPSPVVASTDRSDAYNDGCWIYAPFGSLKTCTYGTGPIKVALVGNSHAGQWLPALQVLAKKDGWTITTFLASQCNATDAPLEFGTAAKSDGCLAYGQWVMDRTKGSAFDLVVTSERQSVRARGDSWADTWPAVRAGYESYLQQWSDARTNVLVLRDTPFPGKTVTSIPDCLSLHRSNHDACSGTPASWRSADPQYDAAVALALPGITTIDPTSYLCTDTTCPAVIGTLIAYFDASHMTATYARSIAPFIEPELLAAIGGGAAP